MIAVVEPLLSRGQPTLYGEFYGWWIDVRWTVTSFLILVIFPAVLVLITQLVRSHNEVWE